MKNTPIIGATILTLAMSPAFAEKWAPIVQSNTKEQIEKIIWSKLTAMRAITGPASSKIVFYKNKAQVWDSNLKPRKDVDSESLHKWPMSGCYGSFFADKKYLYGVNGKMVPWVSPKSSYIWNYSSAKLWYATVSVYKDSKWYWTIPGLYVNLNSEKPKRISSLKWLHKVEIETVCD